MTLNGPTSFNPRSLRVLMLATYFPKPQNSRIGNWALSQAQALLRRGLEVDVISLTAWVPPALARTTHGARAYALCPRTHQWGDLSVSYPRWPVYPLDPFRSWAERNPRPFLDFGWLHARRFIEGKIAEFQPNLIYAHHTAVNGYLATLIQRSFGLPFVVTDHDFGEITSCADFPKRKALFRQVTDSSSRMVSVATRMEQEMVRLFPQARTATVHNGTDPIPDELLNTPHPQEFSGRMVIFSCGAFYERKGFPFLIDAFSEVANKHPNAVLRIAGDGEQRAAIEARIRHHHLENSVQLLGYLPHLQVLQEMAWCDVFALLGWDEPFATVFSEACSAGKPIVCCNDGGFNDVLRHEVHGLTIPPRDMASAVEALGRILSDDVLRQRLGAAARDLFERNLMWDHNAARMEAIFRDAIVT